MGYLWREDTGYGDWGNPAEILHMRKKSPEEQKARIKELWQENPEKCFEYLKLKHSVQTLKIK